MLEEKNTNCSTGMLREKSSAFSSVTKLLSKVL